MKLIKNSMRIWFTLASLFSFLTGWALLAHANKPAPLQIESPSISSSAPQLPSPSFNNNLNNGGLPFSGQFQAPSFSPRLRTGGS